MSETTLNYYSVSWTDSAMFPTNLAKLFSSGPCSSIRWNIGGLPNFALMLILIPTTNENEIPKSLSYEFSWNNC